MTDACSQQTAVRSPCVSVCALNSDDVCIGCYRTANEIAAWSGLSNDQKRAVLVNVARRENQSGFVMTIEAKVGDQ